MNVALHNISLLVARRAEVETTMVKFSNSGKTTEIWKNTHLVLTLLNNFQTKGKIFFQTYWPSHNTWTLEQKKIDVAPCCTLSACLNCSNNKNRKKRKKPFLLIQLYYFLCNFRFCTMNLWCDSDRMHAILTWEDGSFNWLIFLSSV